MSRHSDNSHNQQPIPFHIPHLTGSELPRIGELIHSGRLRSDGRMGKACEQQLGAILETHRVMLTSSCTHALEMAGLLLNIGPGDEIIIPAFTHYSTANAFLLRGASIVWVDIDPDMLTLDLEKTTRAISASTRAVVPVHYGGISCDMDQLLKLANDRDIAVIEDSALSLGSTYKNHMLGSLGTFGCLSFHSGKNLTSGGEGGAIVIGSEDYLHHAEIIREMGTDRAAFHRGQLSEFSWQGLGSSYLMNELSAAFLTAQLEHESEIRELRLRLWELYHTLLEPVETSGAARRPVIPTWNGHNGHTYFIRTDNRKSLQDYLRNRGIETAPHYPALPATPFGKSSPRFFSPEPTLHAETAASSLLRLPLYPDLTEDQVIYICREILEYFGLSQKGSSND